jgi:hypothetical protein
MHWMNKKGDLSIQVIVVAAIALVVLIILVVIFASRTKSFGESATNSTNSITGQVCGAKGGICRDSGVSCQIISGNDWIDCTSTQQCCRIGG